MADKKTTEKGYLEVGNAFEKKILGIVDYIQSQFVGGRTITVAKLEDDTYGISVENPQSSGRALQSTMRLTEESLLALLASCMLYFQHNDIDMAQKLTDMINNENINYSYTKE